MNRSLARAWFAGLLALTLTAVLVAGVRANEVPQYGGPQPPTNVFPATRITLSQPCAQPAQPLGVSGVGFAPNVQVSLSVDATAAGTAMTAANGSFSVTITIPGTLQPGQHLVRAIPPAGSQVNASLQFTSWKQTGFDTTHTRYDPCETALSPTTVPNLTQSWMFTTAGSANFMRSAPVVSHGIVYAGSDGTTLYAFDAASGATLWTFQSGQNVGSETSPAYAGGLVYVASSGSSTGYLYALNGQTGALAWKATIPAGSPRPPVVAGGVVYEADGPLYAFNAATGAQLWVSTASTMGFDQPTVGGPIAGDPLMGGAPSGHLLAASTAGGQFVYAQGSTSSTLAIFALNASNGSVAWTRPIDGYVSGAPVYWNGGLYFAQTYPYVVYALDAQTGAVRWTNSTLGSSTETNLAVAYNRVYMNGFSGVYALDTQTGAVQLFISAFVDGQWSPPTVANGVLYTVEYDNQVHAYDALSGAALWQGSIQSYWYAPGAVLDAGSLYIAAGDNLYAFRLPS